MCTELTPCQKVGNKHGFTKHKAEFCGLKYGQWLTKWHWQITYLVIAISLMLTVMPPYTTAFNSLLLGMWIGFGISSGKAYSDYKKQHRSHCLRRQARQAGRAA